MTLRGLVCRVLGHRWVRWTGQSVLPGEFCARCYVVRPVVEWKA